MNPDDEDRNLEGRVRASADVGEANVRAPVTFCTPLAVPGRRMVLDERTVGRRIL